MSKNVSSHIVGHLHDGRNEAKFQTD
jgi:hypothetical protein